MEEGKRCHVRSYFSNELVEDKEGPNQAVSNKNEEGKCAKGIVVKILTYLVIENKDNKTINK